jgi:hypothetical protein
MHRVPDVGCVIQAAKLALEILEADAARRLVDGARFRGTDKRGD